MLVVKYAFLERDKDVWIKHHLLEKCLTTWQIGMRKMLNGGMKAIELINVLADGRVIKNGLDDLNDMYLNVRF